MENKSETIREKGTDSRSGAHNDGDGLLSAVEREHGRYNALTSPTTSKLPSQQTSFVGCLNFCKTGIASLACCFCLTLNDFDPAARVAFCSLNQQVILETLHRPERQKEALPIAPLMPRDERHYRLFVICNTVVFSNELRQNLTSVASTLLLMEPKTAQRVTVNFQTRIEVVGCSCPHLT
jgi:hypothetical protein